MKDLKFKLKRYAEATTDHQKITYRFLNEKDEGIKITVTFSFDTNVPGEFRDLPKEYNEEIFADFSIKSVQTKL